MTVGDVHFYPFSKDKFNELLDAEMSARALISGLHGATEAREQGPEIEQHEAIHSRQWARYPKAEFFVAKYLGYETLRSLWKTGDPSDGNSFEMDANLYWGGYERHPALP
ncbi:hypothetical protein ACFQ7B_05085 [Streptomyces erythrochromogenes]